MQSIFLIGATGLMGIFCRYGLDRLIVSGNFNFPRSTFVINILGSFLAGLIYALGEREAIQPALQTALLVGFCGGFTTFSAYALQTVLLADKEEFVTAAAYFFMSPVAGFLAALMPIFILRKFWLS